MMHLVFDKTKLIISWLKITGMTIRIFTVIHWITRKNTKIEIFT